MSIIRNVLVRVGADINPLQQGMTQAQRTMGTFRGNMAAATSSANASSSIIGSAVGKLAGIIAGAFAVSKLVEFGKSSIELASNLNEVQNVVDVTFGSMSNQIDAWSKNAVTQFGISELTAKQFASTLGAMFKSSGLAGQQITTMSEQMSGLAADMASFYNLNQSDAFQKIQSGLAGEVEPLRQLGINMSQANLQNFAMQHGIKGNIQTMSQANQIMLRYQYLLSVTKDAQGDFARTSNSWANQTRLLNQQWQIFQTTMGQAFINILTPTLSVINTLLAKLQVAAQYFKAFTVAIFGSASVVSQSTGATAASINQTSAALGGLGTAAKSAGAAAQKALAPFDQLNVLSKNTGAGASSAIGGGGTVGNLGGAVTLPTINAPDTSAITQKVTAFVQKVKSTLQPLFDFISNHKQGIEDAGKAALFFVGAWKVVEIMSFIQQAGGLITVIKNITLAVEAGTVAKIADKLETMALTAMYAKDFVVGLADSAAAFVANTVEIVAQTVATLALNVVIGAQMAITTLATAATWAFNAAIAVLTSPITLVIAAIALLGLGVYELVKHWDTVKKAGSDAWQYMKNVWNEAGAWFQAHITGPIGNFFSNMWAGIKNNIRAGINVVIDAINGFTKGLNWIPQQLSKIPGFGWAANFQIPTIHHLATGGIVTKPILTTMGENFKSEAVVPLENSSFIQSFADTIASAIKTNGATSGGSAGPDTLVLKIGETELARVVIRAINNYHRQIGASLLTV